MKNYFLDHFSFQSGQQTGFVYPIDSKSGLIRGKVLLFQRFVNPIYRHFHPTEANFAKQWSIVAQSWLQLVQQCLAFPLFGSKSGKHYGKFLPIEAELDQLNIQINTYTIILHVNYPIVFISKTKSYGNI